MCPILFFKKYMGLPTKLTSRPQVDVTVVRRTLLQCDVAPSVWRIGQTPLLLIVDERTDLLRLVLITWIFALGAVTRRLR